MGFSLFILAIVITLLFAARSQDQDDAPQAAHWARDIRTFALVFAGLAMANVLLVWFARGDAVMTARDWRVVVTATVLIALLPFVNGLGRAVTNLNEWFKEIDDIFRGR